MAAIQRLIDTLAEMTAWRHDLHAHPETAFEEHRTAGLIADKLAGFGIAVQRGLARTGVVGTLAGRHGDGPAIGLRADMDALAMDEKNRFAHRSTEPGKMHACGHDGHSAMLLGAARYLAETRDFAGTVQFIFQPAEENEGGGRAMIEDGLFDRFPMDAVFGLHNMPGLAAGSFAMRAGPMMAAFDVFEIALSGRGAHAAMPHLGTDAIVAAAHLVTALQTLVSRAVDPLESAVVSVTQIHGGSAWNVLPEDVVLRGTTRHFRATVQQSLEDGIRRIAAGVAAAHGVGAELRYERRYPATVNTAPEAAFAAEVAAGLVGEDALDRAPPPLMGAEDFAFMLRERPGCYAWIGNGPGTGGCHLHNPHYDFNDAILPLGASYWVRLVETRLARR